MQEVVEVQRPPVLQREQWPFGLPHSTLPSRAGRGSFGKRKESGETVGLTLLGLAHLLKDLAWEGDTSQLARPPASGDLEMVVCVGPLDSAGEGMRGSPEVQGRVLCVCVCPCVSTCVSSHTGSNK